MPAGTSVRSSGSLRAGSLRLASIQCVSLPSQPCAVLLSLHLPVYRMVAPIALLLTHRRWCCIDAPRTAASLAAATLQTCLLVRLRFYRPVVTLPLRRLEPVDEDHSAAQQQEAPAEKGQQDAALASESLEEAAAKSEAEANKVWRSPLLCCCSWSGSRMASARGLWNCTKKPSHPGWLQTTLA